MIVRHVEDLPHPVRVEVWHVLQADVLRLKATAEYALRKTKKT